MTKALTFIFLLISFSCSHYPSQKTVVWKLDNPASIGGNATMVSGNPMVVRDDSTTALYFNGVNDGIFIPDIPIKGWLQFTIEAHFFPASTGPVEPRFLHFEDSLQNRGTLEVRLTQGKEWYLDAFLKNGTTGKGFALIDSTKLHAADQWFWVAMVYDGKSMRSFVNGQQELQQDFNFPAVGSGKLSLGVRLNKVNWFQGKISEVRFHPTALAAHKLQHY